MLDRLRLGNAALLAALAAFAACAEGPEPATQPGAVAWNHAPHGTPRRRALPAVRLASLDDATPEADACGITLAASFTPAGAEPPAPPDPDRPLACCDGTLSPTCTCGGPRRGCCSHHKGVCGCSD